MNFEKAAKTHPLLTLVKVAVSSGALVATVVGYFCFQSKMLLENKVSTLESNLGSIRRGLPGNEYLDIRTFIRPRSERGKVGAPRNSRYYDEDGFYASSDDRHWKYEKTMADRLIEALVEEPLTADEKKLFKDLPINLWRATEQLRPADPEVFPPLNRFITLEKTSVSAIMDKIDQTTTSEPSEIESPLKTNDVKAFLDHYERVFRGDVVGHALRTQLQGRFLVTLDQSELNYEIVEIQKVGNVVYLRSLTTVHPKVKGKRGTAEYFLHEEYLFISDRTDLFVVHIFAASKEPSLGDQIHARITEWLMSLLVFVG